MSNGVKSAKKDEMSDAEALASYNAFLRTQEGLEDAIALLKAQKVSFSTSPVELKLIRIQLADSEADLAKVRARLTAFLAGNLTMTPPSKAVLNRITQQAEILDQLIVKAQTADTIIAAAVALAKAWEETQTT